MECVRGSAGPTDLASAHKDLGAGSSSMPPRSWVPPNDSELWDHNSAIKQKTNEEQDKPLFRCRLKFGEKLSEQRKTVPAGRPVSFYSQETFPADLRDSPTCLETDCRYRRRGKRYRELTSDRHQKNSEPGRCKLAPARASSLRQEGPWRRITRIKA